MIKSIIFPQRYVQGTGALLELPSLLKKCGKGKTILVIIDPGVESFMKPKITDILQNDFLLHFVSFSGESTQQQMEQSSQKIIEVKADFVLGVGGGKAIDTAKGAVHFSKQSTLVIIPTIVASDASCSKNAVVYTEDHKVDRDIHGRANPELIVIDSEIIAQAPTRFLSAGIGDALATWFEAESHQKTMIKNFTGYSGTITGYAIARLCYDTLLENAALAVQHSDLNIVSPQLEAVIEANSLMSTIGFESGGLGAAHGFHQGIAEWKETHNVLHGEKVSIGIGAALFLTHKPEQLIKKTYEFLHTVRLPLCLSDIGVKEYNKDYLMVAVRRMMEPQECTHNEPIVYEAADYIHAFIAADEYGKKIKKIRI